MKNRILALMAISLSCLLLQSCVQKHTADSKKVQNDSVFVEVTQDGKVIDETIARAWFASNDLETFLGLVSLVSRADEYAVTEISRQKALNGARHAAAKLENELETLQNLRDAATRDQRRAIDGMVLVADGRVSGLNATLAAFGEGGGLKDVTSCTGFWCCLGFKAGCKGANGKWEDQGGGVETCTTKPVKPER